MRSLLSSRFVSVPVLDDPEPIQRAGRELDAEPASATGLTLDFDRAAHQVQEACADRKSQAGPSVLARCGVVELLEGPKQAVKERSLVPRRSLEQVELANRALGDTASVEHYQIVGMPGNLSPRPRAPIVFERTVILAVKDRGLLPERALWRQNRDLGLALSEEIWEVFGCIALDRNSLSGLLIGARADLHPYDWGDVGYAPVLFGIQRRRIAEVEIDLTILALHELDLPFPAA